MPDPSRRDVLGMLAGAAALPVGVRSTMTPFAAEPRACAIRTITAGITLGAPDDLAPVESAIAALERGRTAFTAEGFTVQTLRLASNPFVAGLDARARDAALPALQRLDALARERKVSMSIGPVLTGDVDAPGLAAWVAELVRTTTQLQASVMVSVPEVGAQPRAVRAAAEVIVALSRVLPSGAGNFRFAAAASVPPGTPFFPVAWHRGPASLAAGLESAGVLEAVFAQASDSRDATGRLRARLNELLAPVEVIGRRQAQTERREWLGIDSSPAPSKVNSIGAAIEALTHAPFGSATTLDACSAITAALKSLDVTTCGYSGLMLPVLEDPVLARRAGEGRFTLRDLLLFSAVCGTGLDTVPIPGDTPVETIAGIILDVAAMASRLRKPLSARLFLVPGKKAGEVATFTESALTDSAVLEAR